MVQSIPAHLFEARQSLQRAFDRLQAQERLARDAHLSDLLHHITVAGQAGDAATLISDQLVLVPDSRKRLRATFDNLQVILTDLVSEWRLITRDAHRDMVGAPPNNADARDAHRESGTA